MGPIHKFSGHRAPIYFLAHAHRSRAFLSGSGDGTVVEWSLDHPEKGVPLVNVEQAIFSLHPLHHQHLLLIGTESGGLHLVDLQRREETQLLKVHHKGIFRIIGHQGTIYCAGGDGSLSIWRLNNGRLELHRQIPLIEEKLRDLALDESGKVLAVAGGDGRIRIFDTAELNETHTVEAHMDAGEPTEIQGVTSLHFHPGKPVLISGGKDGHLRCWNVRDRYRPVFSVPAHKGGIYRIAFNVRLGICATASRDRTAKCWNASTFDPLQRLDRGAGGHSHSVNALLWCDDVLLTAGDDRTIIGWRS